MIVKCSECGKEIIRQNPTKHNFCCNAHRLSWNRKNVNFSEISKLHKAPNLTKLNSIRNPMCSVANRGKVNSKKARMAATEYLGRELDKGEVVHHMNGIAADNRHENLLVMTDREHRQLHMALAIEKYEKRGEENAKE